VCVCVCCGKKEKEGLSHPCLIVFKGQRTPKSVFCFLGFVNVCVCVCVCVERIICTHKKYVCKDLTLFLFFFWDVGCLGACALCVMCVCGYASNPSNKSNNIFFKLVWLIVCVCARCVVCGLRALFVCCFIKNTQKRICVCVCVL